MKIILVNQELLKKTIMLQGHSQRSFAQLAEISAPYLNQVVNGERNPSPSIAKHICYLLNLNLEDVFEIK